MPAFCADKEKISIFAHDNNPPYVQMDETGIPSGIAIDIMKSIEKKSSYSFEYILIPWKRAYKLALKGKGAIIGISKTTERMEIFNYSNVLYNQDISIVVKKGKEFPFNQINDLKAKIVAVHRGSVYTDDYAKALKDGLFTVVKTNSRSQRLLMLLKGRVDAAIVARGMAGVLEVIDQRPEFKGSVDKFFILPHPLLRDPNYLAISKQLDAAKFIKEFNQALEQGEQSGEFERIVQRYMHNPM